MSSQGFLTSNIANLTGALESVLLNERLSRLPGFLQGLDPRAKLSSLVLLIAVAGLARHLWILLALLGLVMAMEFSARVAPTFFLKRLLLFLPFTAIVALPALFITPGEAWLQIGARTIITVQGAHTAAFLLLRVLDSISFGLLLILTTPWTELLAALRWFRLPPLFIDVLAMTYRYIFLFLHSANAMFLARRSRSLGWFSTGENRRWLARSLVTVIGKSQHMGEEVYQAMLARGYQGESFSSRQPRMRVLDLAWLAASAATAAILIWSSYR